MSKSLVFILILTVLLVACTSESAPPPQPGNDAAPQAVATAAPITRPPTETPTAATPPLQTAPTDTHEPTATVTPEPTPTLEPTPTTTTTPPPAIAEPTATTIAELPTLPPTPTLPPARPTVTATPTIPTLTLRVTVSPIPSILPTYDRHDWKHWTDGDGDCQDARQEVLVAESRIGPDFRTDRKCRVTSGEWLTPYTGTVVTDPGKLDIDHMVPLGNAHISGASNWSANQRKRYANYLDDPQHLIAVTASANRSKGARGPEDWKPDDRSYWCQYAVDWITIKDDWGLTVTQQEHDALVEMLNTSANRPHLTVSHQRQVSPTPATTSQPSQPATTPTPQMRTYANCDAAQAAGERRVQGSKGGGRGFPKWMVPSARDGDGDGDGDGVVCEK